MMPGYICVVPYLVRNVALLKRQALQQYSGESLIQEYQVSSRTIADNRRLLSHAAWLTKLSTNSTSTCGIDLGKPLSAGVRIFHILEKHVTVIIIVVALQAVDALQVTVRLHWFLASCGSTKKMCRYKKEFIVVALTIVQLQCEYEILLLLINTAISQECEVPGKCTKTAAVLYVGRHSQSEPLKGPSIITR